VTVEHCKKEGVFKICIVTELPVIAVKTCDKNVDPDSMLWAI